MEPQHVDPEQAVLIHQDVKAKKSVGIHWGTFALANEVSETVIVERLPDLIPSSVISAELMYG